MNIQGQQPTQPALIRMDRKQTERGAKRLRMMAPPSRLPLPRHEQTIGTRLNQQSVPIVPPRQELLFRPDLNPCTRHLSPREDKLSSASPGELESHSVDTPEHRGIRTDSQKDESRQNHDWRGI